MSQAYAWTPSDIPDNNDDVPYVPKPKSVKDGTKSRGRVKHRVSAGNDDAMLLQMKEDGHPIENIAAHFGCSTAIVQRRLKVLSVMAVSASDPVSE